MLKFYQNSEWTICTLLCFLVPETILIILLCINFDKLGMYIIFGIFAFFSVIILAGWKFFFAKIVFDGYGIKVGYGKKVKTFMKWDDVVKVDNTYDINTWKISIFDKFGNEINFDMTKRKVNKIIEICPREDIKAQFKKVKTRLNALFPQRKSKFDNTD